MINQRKNNKIMIYISICRRGELDGVKLCVHNYIERKNKYIKYKYLYKNKIICNSNEQNESSTSHKLS